VNQWLKVGPDRSFCARALFFNCNPKTFNSQLASSGVQLSNRPMLRTDRDRPPTAPLQEETHIWNPEPAELTAAAVQPPHPPHPQAAPRQAETETVVETAVGPLLVHPPCDQLAHFVAAAGGNDASGRKK
jgi:hypothetical protein